MLIITPRHPQRFDLVAALLDAHKLRYVRLHDQGRWTEAWLHLPLVLLERAVRDAREEQGDKYGEARVVRPVSPETVAYYQPRISVRWSPPLMSKDQILPSA